MEATQQPIIPMEEDENAPILVATPDAYISLHTGVVTDTPPTDGKYVPIFTVTEEAMRYLNLPEPKPPKRPDEELSWEDLDESDISRFKLEQSGRCYTVNPMADPITDVLRTVFHSYPQEVQTGAVPPDPNHHSGIFQRDIVAAMEESQRRSDEMNEEIRRRNEAYKARHGVYPPLGF